MPGKAFRFWHTVGVKFLPGFFGRAARGSTLGENPTDFQNVLQRKGRSIVTILPEQFLKLFCGHITIIFHILTRNIQKYTLRILNILSNLHYILKSYKIKNKMTNISKRYYRRR